MVSDGMFRFETKRFDLLAQVLPQPAICYLLLTAQVLPAVEVDAVLYNDGRMGHSLAEADAHPHIRLDLPPADHARLRSRGVSGAAAPRSALHRPFLP